MGAKNISILEKKSARGEGRKERAKEEGGRRTEERR